MANAADHVVGGGLALFHGHDLDGVGLVVGAQNQVITGGFDIFHGAIFVFEDGVHIELALAIGFERVVVTVDEKSSPGQKARVHAHALAGVHFDNHEAFPMLAIAFGFGFQPFQETFLEFQDFLDVHAGDEGLGGGDGAVGQEDVLEFVVAGRQYGSAFVDLGRIEKIEHGKMLDSEDAVHALDAEAALAIEEVGDVSLLESGLLCQTEPRQIAFLDALPNSFAEIVLEDSEFHSGSIARHV